MRKISRNEACPCGSGKKHKKCCGSSDVTKFTPNRINGELYQLHQGFTSFSKDKYNHKINEQIRIHERAFSESNREMIDIYNTGLFIWIMFNVPFFKDKKSLFQHFISHYPLRISPPARNILSKWAHITPSVYEVISMEEKKGFAQVKQIITNKTYLVPFNKGDDLIEGSLIVGTLLPFVDHHNFLYSMIKLYRHDKKEVRQLLQHYTDEKGGINEHFPRFLADTLLLGVEGNNLKVPNYDKVSQLYANHLVDKNVHDEIIMRGVSIWNQYCKEERPSFKKVESYAAALEYLVQKQFLNNSIITQGQLAKEYNTSPGSVSTNYRKLSRTLPNELNTHKAI